MLERAFRHSSLSIVLLRLIRAILARAGTRSTDCAATAHVVFRHYL